MWLQRFTDGHGPSHSVRLLLLAAVAGMLVAGCGSTSGPGKSGKKAAAAAEGERVVPPEAQTMYEQAVAVMAGGDYLEAQLRFQEFLLQYPEFPGAHVNLAIIYASNGDDQGAENSLTDALLLDPAHPVALNQLGMLLRRQGKFDEAEAAYLRAVEADPEYAIAHYNLGVLNDLYLQRLDTALQHYETYQSLGAEDKQVGKWIADLKRRLGASQRTANVTE